MIFSIKANDEIADLQSKEKQVRLVEKLGKQGFHYDITESLEPITKVITDSNQKLLKETISNTKAIEGLDELNVHVNALELLNKNGVIHSSSIRPTTNILVLTNKNQFRLIDDLDSDNWNDYVMN